MPTVPISRSVLLPTRYEPGTISLFQDDIGSHTGVLQYEFSSARAPTAWGFITSSQMTYLMPCRLQTCRYTDIGSNFIGVLHINNIHMKS